MAFMRFLESVYIWYGLLVQCRTPTGSLLPSVCLTMMNLELLTELSLAAAFTMSCSSGWSWRRGLPSFFTTWLSRTWCSADLAKRQLRLVIWRPIFLKAFRFLNPAASSAVDKFCCSPEDWSNESSVVMAVRALPTVWQWQSTRKPCFFKASARPGWSAAAFTTKFLRNEAWESLEKQLCRAELRSKCTATVRGLKSFYFKPQLKVFLNHWTKNPYQTAGLLATQGSCEQVGSGAAKLHCGWFFFVLRNILLGFVSNAAAAWHGELGSAHAASKAASRSCSFTASGKTDSCSSRDIRKNLFMHSCRFQSATCLLRAFEPRAVRACSSSSSSCFKTWYNASRPLRFKTLASPGVRLIPTKKTLSQKHSMVTIEWSKKTVCPSTYSVVKHEPSFLRMFSEVLISDIIYCNSIHCIFIIAILYYFHSMSHYNIIHPCKYDKSWTCGG